MTLTLEQVHALQGLSRGNYGESVCPNCMAGGTGMCQALGLTTYETVNFILDENWWLEHAAICARKEFASRIIAIVSVKS